MTDAVSDMLDELRDDWNNHYPEGLLTSGPPCDSWAFCTTIPLDGKSEIRLSSNGIVVGIWNDVPHNQVAFKRIAAEAETIRKNTPTACRCRFCRKVSIKGWLSEQQRALEYVVVLLDEGRRKRGARQLRKVLEGWTQL